MASVFSFRKSVHSEMHEMLPIRIIRCSISSIAAEFNVRSLPPAFHQHPNQYHPGADRHRHRKWQHSAQLANIRRRSSTTSGGDIALACLTESFGKHAKREHANHAKRGQYGAQSKGDENSE